MDQVEEFPFSFQEIENEWIKMPDGVNLAARLWIPEKAYEEPVPAVFEFIPYRKRDFKRIRDEMNHKYFAGHGYACVRVDIRGSGDSEGILSDEYTEQELSDGENIIKWIAGQKWCNGNVGMIGISWGGFNGLQIAARRPPGLKAVIAICATDDRYADDVHYMGGCLLSDNLSWASVMFEYNSLPPDPEIVGSRWREMWLYRLENNDPWIEKWLRHQRRSEYWKHGSVCEDFHAIQCPVMIVSGWADGYTNAVFRLLEKLSVPTLGLVGPWSHKFPNMGEPGPAIGFLQESTRWWDRWLCDKDTGIDREAKLKLWVQESMPPSSSYQERPGYWLGLEGWPSRLMENQKFILKENKLVRADFSGDEPERLYVKSPLRLGLFAGKWCSYQAPPDLPGDQREEDGGALVFETGRLSEELEAIGSPVADFRIEADKPVAMIAVRLSDIGSDGKATRVTYGVLNLTHRSSHEFPEPLIPGQKYRVRLQLNDIAHVFPKGHRLRVSVSSSYWPLAWPAPELARIIVYTEESYFELPVKKGTPRYDVQFEPPVVAKPTTAKKTVHASEQKWDVIRNLIRDESTLRVVNNTGTYFLEDINLEVTGFSEERYFVRNDEPETLRGEVSRKKKLKRNDWEVETRTYTVLTSDKEYFYIHAQLDAFEGNERIFSRNWKQKARRDLV